MSIDIKEEILLTFNGDSVKSGFYCNSLLKEKKEKRAVKQLICT